MLDGRGRPIARGARVIDDLLEALTPEQQLGQLVLADWPVGTGKAGGTLTLAALGDAIRQGHVGGIRLPRWPDADTSEQMAALADLAVRHAPLGLPLFFCAPDDGGGPTVMPTPGAAAASWSPEAVARAARVVASEAAAAGINWITGPRISAAGTLPPVLEARLLAARIAGLQGDPRIDRDAVLAELALGDPGEGAGKAAHAPASRAARHEAILPAYLAAVRESRVAAVSQAGAPVLDLADPRWDPHGIVVDALLPWSGGPNPVPALAAAVRAGTRPRLPLEEMVRRVLVAKHDRGLLRDPLRARGNRDEPPPGHYRVARDLACRSLVLLKNEGGLLPLPLPLAVGGGEVLVVGHAALARAGDAHLGTASRHSVREGLEAAGISCRYVGGLSLAHADADHDAAPDTVSAGDQMAISLAVSAARRAASVVLVLEPVHGPGGRDDAPTLSAAQRTLLRLLHHANPRLVLVVSGSLQCELGEAVDQCRSLLICGPLGVAAGDAIADVLSGRAAPTGRLPHPVRFTGGPAAGRVRFPLGYGLGYGRFTCSVPQVDRDTGIPRLCFTVQAAGDEGGGDMRGEAMVQLYLRSIGAAPEPTPRLAAFLRLSLAPGESRLVEMVLGPAELGRLDADGRREVAAGAYELTLGANAETGARTVFSLSAGQAAAVMRWGDGPAEHPAAARRA